MAALLAACTTPDLTPDPGSADAGEAAEPRSSATPDLGDDGAVPPPATTPDAEAPHGPDGAVPACDATDLDAIDVVIGDQLAAFAADDYDRALELASEGFRAAIDAEGLAGIIEDGYPVAADAASHETGACVRPTPTSAEVLVRVTARDGERGDLVYRMVEEAPGWRIAGAVQVGQAPQDDVTLAAAAAG